MRATALVVLGHLGHKPAFRILTFLHTVGPPLFKICLPVSALGVYQSLKVDLPTDATIVCTFGAVLAVMVALRGVIKRAPESGLERQRAAVSEQEL
jgi:hypothetical protein